MSTLFFAHFRSFIVEKITKSVFDLKKRGVMIKPHITSTISLN